jgi:hypothetical protein
MSLEFRNGHHYGKSQDDIREQLLTYSKSNGYPCEHYANAECKCMNRTFRLFVDDITGAAVRICTGCAMEHPMGDSARYLDEATLEECECPCSSTTFQVTAGVALYSDSMDVRWLYLGCRCPNCDLIGIYADWKMEESDYSQFLTCI